MNIDTPKKYKGLDVKVNEWRNDSISRILKDSFYTGEMVINKYVSNCITKKKTKTPVEDWIILENTHEALISKEDFERVQDLLNKNYHKPRVKYEYLLKDLVYCGHCKSRMQYKYRLRTKVHNKVLEEPQKCWYFKCRMLYRFPSICDKGHTINEKDLNEIVLQTIRKRLEKIKIDNTTNKIIDEYKKSDAMYNLIITLQNSKIKIENNMKKLYSKRVDETITIENFKIEYDRLKKKLNEIEKQLEELQEKNKNKISEDNLKKIAMDFKQGKEFTNEILKQLINRIEVYEDKRVEIEFNF